MASFAFARLLLPALLMGQLLTVEAYTAHQSHSDSSDGEVSYSRSLQDGQEEEEEFKYGPSTITLISTIPSTYRAQRAAFGDPMVNAVVRVNLMAPPNRANFCQFPQYILDNSPAVDASFDNDSFSLPIALLVSDNDCSPEQKARVLMQIQRNVTAQVKYLVIYGTNRSDNDKLLELQPDNPGDPATYEDLQSVGIFYVPYRYGQDLSSRMVQIGVAIQADPRFVRPFNKRWSFFVRIADTVEGDAPFYSSRSQNTDSNADSFYWFRFVLFTLLIMSPCCRAVYLWWAAGGRLQFRRSEQGRITGIQYIPPMEYWLSSGLRPSPDADPVSTTLNEEQFDALPEILFKSKPEEQEEGASTVLEEEIVVNISTDAIGLLQVPNAVGVGSAAGTSPSEEGKGDVEQTSPVATYVLAERALTGLASAGPLVDTHTTCTTCSICIDEFEVGERLTLLPKCQHAFHRDCIRPWLMERQGCCPLCKKNVLQAVECTDPEGSVEESDDNIIVPESIRQRESGLEVQRHD